MEINHMIQPSKFASKVGFSLSTYLETLHTVQQNKDNTRVWMLAGDPVVYGRSDIRMANQGYQEVKKAIRNPENHSYILSVGTQPARKAIIKHFAGGRQIDPSDVIITSGVNMGLLYCLEGICNPGENILVPETGYPFYDELAPGRDVEVRKYRLLKQKNFEIDLDHVRSLVDENTKFIYIVNPSNPMGSVFSKQHLLSLLQLAEELKLLIVADEVYYGMAFQKGAFHSIGHLSKQTPVITLCGLEKVFCVPGWATSWMMLFDPKGYMKQIKLCLQTVTSLFIHTNVFLQKSLPALLDILDGPNYTDKFMKVYKQNNQYILSKCKQFCWLKPYSAQGALFIVVEVDLSVFPTINSDVDLTRSLLAQQNVNLIPLSVMGNLCGVRLLTCCTNEMYDELFQRLRRFYNNNKQKQQ